MYFKYRHLNTDIHLYAQADNEYPRLLQHSKLHPLSWLRDDNGDKPKAVINCSYFTPQYVCGRNQGDLKNDTHDQPGYYDLVLLKGNKYAIGNFNSWDYQSNPDVLAGFSVGAILIKDGDDTSLLSTAIVTNAKIYNKDPQTALAILEDGSCVFIVSDGRSTSNRGLTGIELRDFIRYRFSNVELLVLLDGGGSSEMIVESTIKNDIISERKMFNGLAFIQKRDDFGYVEEEVVINPNTQEIVLENKQLKEKIAYLEDLKKSLLEELEELLKLVKEGSV